MPQEGKKRDIKGDAGQKVISSGKISLKDNDETPSFYGGKGKVC